MDRPPTVSLAFPRPGRALAAVLVVMGVLGIGLAFLSEYAGAGMALFSWMVFRPATAFQEPWRLVSSGLLTSPAQWGHLLFSLVGLYFLGAPLERRWGGGRFLRLLALAVVFGNLAIWAVDRLAPADLARFHRGGFGPGAAIAAVAVAWSREFSTSTVSLMFVLPIRGKTLLWVTLGFCVLGLIYPDGTPEGAVAPFGGLLAGLLLGGTPSIARSAWLHTRLALLRRRATLLDNGEISMPPSSRKRSGTPPLRVVPGGLEDVLKKRKPPSDKRYLN
jgi:membrane associated rhomboid family serine protease